MIYRLDASIHCAQRLIDARKFPGGDRLLGEAIESIDEREVEDRVEHERAKGEQNVSHDDGRKNVFVSSLNVDYGESKRLNVRRRDHMACATDRGLDRAAAPGRFNVTDPAVDP